MLDAALLLLLLLLAVPVVVAVLLPIPAPVTVLVVPLFPLPAPLPAPVPPPLPLGTEVCVPFPSVHGYSLGGIVSADASSAACERSGLVKTSQLGRSGEAGIEFVMAMGRAKMV